MTQITQVGRSRGRPSVYTKELVKEICDSIASSSKGVMRLCAENPHWPNKDTIFTWIKNNDEFSDQYARAKRCQVESFIDDMIEIADDSSGDVTLNEHGGEVYNAERVARSRLRIDTRKWIACKLVPRVYGDSKLHEEQSSESTINKIASMVKEFNKTNQSEY